MSKLRADQETLKAKVGDPGFTPSLRDASSLVELLADPDEKVARDAERALVRVGPTLVPRAVELAARARAPVRAGIARLLGRMVDVPAAQAWLVTELENEEPRVRRGAAHALGKLDAKRGAKPVVAEGAGGDADALPDVEALLRAFTREPDGPERRAIASALGKAGSTRALEALRACASKDPELARIVAQATLMLTRDAARSAGGVLDADRAASVPLAVVLHCRDGLEGLVAEEVPTAPGLAVGSAPVRVGAVTAVLTGPLRSLFAVRTMTFFGFELVRAKAQSAADVERVLVDAVVSERSRTILEGFTVGPVRYRIAFRSGGHRRALVWRCVQAIAAHRPTWINDPTDTAWIVAVHESANEISVELRPHGLEDTRFLYRKRDVPAASQPTLAAALVRVAGVRADDVVWDPFVGSGTELVERARAGAYQVLHGSDTDDDALEAARENFEAASLEGVRLVRADATTYAPEGVTLVITNPPMGRRVVRSAELATTLDEFVDHVGRVLVPGGRFVWLSPHPARTAARAQAAGLVLESAREVDMGGFPAQLQRFVKRRSH